MNWVLSAFSRSRFDDIQVFTKLMTSMARAARSAASAGLHERWWSELRAQPEPRTQSVWASKTKPEIERGSGEGTKPPPQNFFENSYLKPCILVYSWSENLYFCPADLGTIGPDFRCLHGSFVKPPIIGSRMKPQLYIPTILIHFKVMLISTWKNRLFQKHVRLYMMVQINPHSEPLPRFEEGFQLCGPNYTLLDRPFSIQDWNSW